MSAATWKAGYRHVIAAPVAHKALERVRKRHGDLTAENVVEAARPENNPLHPQIFDKDLEGAAEEYYRENARGMIRSITIERAELPETPTRVYEIVRVSGSEGEPSRQVYRKTEEILADPSSRRQLLARAKSELKSFRTRYSGLQELSKVIQAADEIL